MVSPTMSPPIRPGPAAAATPSRAGKVRWASAIALGDDVVEGLDMGASGDLRHHAAEGGVLADLREHDIGENPALGLIGPFDHGGGGLITGRLDAEDHHGCIIGFVLIARYGAREGAGF